MKFEKDFLEAYDQTSEKLYRHIFFRVNNKELAEDLLQQTYFKAWRYLGENQGDFKHLRALFYRIAENLVIDYYRQKPRMPVSTETILELASSERPDINTDTIMQTEKAMKILDTLGENVKQLVLLKYLDGLSTKEMSQATGLTVTNINVTIHRAIKHLKKNLV